MLCLHLNVFVIHLFNLILKNLNLIFISLNQIFLDCFLHNIFACKSILLLLFLLFIFLLLNHFGQLLTQFFYLGLLLLTFLDQSCLCAINRFSILGRRLINFDVNIDALFVYEIYFRIFFRFRLFIWLFNKLCLHFLILHLFCISLWSNILYLFCIGLKFLVNQFFFRNLWINIVWFLKYTFVNN